MPAAALGALSTSNGIRDIEPLAVGLRLPLDCQAGEVRHEEDVARLEFKTYVPFGQRYLTFEHVANDGVVVLCEIDRRGCPYLPDPRLDRSLLWLADHVNGADLRIAPFERLGDDFPRLLQHHVHSPSDPRSFECCNHRRPTK